LRDQAAREILRRLRAAPAIRSNPEAKGKPSTLPSQTHYWHGKGRNLVTAKVGTRKPELTFTPGEVKAGWLVRMRIGMGWFPNVKHPQTATAYA
jgi:hypothetical protein